jgi:hypothetical protein
MTLTRKEKLDLMPSLNWDYLDKPEDMLAVIEGDLASSGAFTREKLFVRSLERLSWYRIIGLWGVEEVKKLYTPKLAGRIWPKDRRKDYDFAFAILRREPVSPPRWGDEHYKSARYRFFLNRGNGS